MKSKKKKVETKPRPLWVKTTPKTEGWYWIRYKNKHNRISEVPCEVVIIGDATLVHTAKNTTFIEGPNHGGKGLKWDGKLDKSIRFGPAIPRPGTK